MLSRISRRCLCTATPQPWLFVGLGNPGDKYKTTRHNVGFKMIDAFAESQGIPVDTVHCKALFGKGFVDGVPVFLAKPQTYMNLSGESRSGFGKGDSIALDMTKSGADCSVLTKPYPDPVADLVVGGLLAAYSQKWTKHRKIISPAFHLEKLKCMLPAINLSCDDMIKKWEILVSTNGYAEVDVWPYLEDLSGDMISRAAFGSNLEEGRIIFQLHKEQTNLGFKMMGLSYTKAFRPWFFPPAKPDKRMIQIEGEIQAQIKRVINKREKATKIGEGNIDDLLSILMESNTKEIQEDDEGMRMSMEEVIDECKMFYTAGANSASRLLVWIMIMLSAHPNWQTRAREEVLQVFGNKKLYFDGLNHLKIVTMILQEVLRLYPPTSMAIRAVSKKTKLGNMTIPPWVQLTLPIILHQYDPKTWGNDAMEFKPERFSEGISNATCTKNSSSFLPFSGGPRICVGHNFAMMEAKIAIARILQRFPLIQLSPSYVHAPELFFLLRPQYGAKLILHN